MTSIDEAAQRIANSEIVAVPTDTVYGLAANPFDEMAVERLYQLKGRDENSPLLILGVTQDDFLPLLDEPLPSWVGRFWPGPLTLVLEANSSEVPEWVRRGRPTLGVRVPNHEVALDLLRRTGPLAVTSANPSGRDPALDEEEVRAHFGADFPVLAGGRCRVGVASTIVGLSPFKVFREGSISQQEIEAML